jgi:ParB family chromosome partitioning protein
VVARHSGLGKGLGALLPTEVIAGAGSELLHIPVTSIRPNSHQPRSAFDEEAMASLTASIREVGVLQPVLVRPVGDDSYELVAGERRLRAAKRAGLPTIPALVRQVSDPRSLEEALIENLHRQDLNPLEEAGAYQQLIEDFGLTHEQLATRVGKSRVTITNSLRLFQLPPAVQKMISDGQLSAGHARALLGTPDRGFQEALARKAVDEQLSVRAVEEAVRGHVAGTTASAESPRRLRLRPPGILELEDLLSGHLDTKVRVQLGTRNRGKVIIEFATLEDLERIYRAMTEPEPSPRRRISPQTS